MQLWENGAVAIGSVSERSRFRVLVAMLATLASAAIVAIYPVQRVPGGDPSIPGYTLSLGLIYLPLVVLAPWLARHLRRDSASRKALWRTALLVIPAWTLLDILLAHTLFCFPRTIATLGVNLPGFKPPRPSALDCSPDLAAGFAFNIPIEEFLFYLGGCVLMVVLYIWSSEEWFEAYNSPAMSCERQARAVQRAVRFFPTLALWGVALAGAVLIYKAWGAPEPLRAGVPLYALLMIAWMVVPNAFLYRVVGPSINERALLFTMTSVVLVSLIWEVTLALPNGWWNYQPRWMMGLFIAPWSGIPAEAVFLWVAAGFGNVVFYEFFRLHAMCGRTLWSFLSGR